MGIYGSYDDYTANRGSLTEGLSGGRNSGKLGTLYSRAAMVPATHKKLVVKLRINEVSKYLEDMAPDRFERMCLDLQLGYIIRLRGDIYVKQQKTGEYFVYRKPGERSERSTKKRRGRLTRLERKEQVDEIYAHLKAIKDRKWR